MGTSWHLVIAISMFLFRQASGEMDYVNQRTNDPNEFLREIHWVSVACPCGKKIEMTSARYGYHQSDCGWTISAFHLMKVICDNRRYCPVSAEPAIFGNPKCPPKHNVLQVEWECIPDKGLKIKRVEEGQTMKIACHKGKHINVQKGFYGKEIDGCYYWQAHKKVQIECQGKPSCTLKASDKFFYKKCRSTDENYLEVAYTCDGGTPISEEVCSR